jgi:hypothetical protein
MHFGAPHQARHPFRHLPMNGLQSVGDEKNNATKDGDQTENTFRVICSLSGLQ